MLNGISERRMFRLDADTDADADADAEDGQSLD